MLYYMSKAIYHEMNWKLEYPTTDNLGGIAINKSSSMGNLHAGVTPSITKILRTSIWLTDRHL